jgi:hypothetical protein
MVLLADGRLVPNDSPEWLVECEAYAILAMEIGRRRDFLQLLTDKRGPAAVEVIRSRMAAVEPAYVLSLPDRQSRQAYLIRTERDLGANAKTSLELRVRSLWDSRKSAKGAAA